PQINADERRFIASYYESNWISCFSVTPKNNATGKSRGNALWWKMFLYFQLNQEDFMKHYHKRSNVESTFNMIKAKLGDKLKSKNFVAQKNELLCKLIAHNIIVLIHEMYELGIKPDFCIKIYRFDFNEYKKL
ncbi:MAG: transposase, partial [Candidatus Methanoperedens sp.]